MSFLDMDERLLSLAERADLVYSPLVDVKEFPENVDVTLVEGSVSSEEDWHRIHTIRQRTKTLVSFGDCAVTGNVPSMRNAYGTEATLRRVYQEADVLQPQIPNQVVSRLLTRVRPVHEVVKVDLFMPGCPPSADTIYFFLTELLEGRSPDLSARTRFGA
jgi:NAD-reducing hydrogenase small subunit